MKQEMATSNIPTQNLNITDDELAESLKNHRPIMRVVPNFGLSESEVAELSVLLGFNITVPVDLLRAVRNVTTLSVDGVEITLDSYLLNRLKSRCHPTQDFPEFLRERVKELLAGYCGA